MTRLTIKVLNTYTHVCITFSLPKMYATCVVALEKNLIIEVGRKYVELHKQCKYHFTK